MTIYGWLVLALLVAWVFFLGKRLREYQHWAVSWRTAFEDLRHFARPQQEATRPGRRLPRALCKEVLDGMYNPVSDWHGRYDYEPVNDSDGQ